MCAYFADGMHKCGIEYLGPDFVKRICGYRGFGEEFVRHVKKVHHSNWFLMKNKQITFEWKLPYIGDLMTISILHSNDEDYLYKVHYKNETQSLHHSIIRLEDMDVRNEVTTVNLTNINQICRIVKSCDNTRHLNWNINLTRFGLN